MHKPGRRLVRPALERTYEKPHTEKEMPAVEAPTTTEEVKNGTTSHEPEVPTNRLALCKLEFFLNDRTSQSVFLYICLIRALRNLLLKYFFTD